MSLVGAKRGGAVGWPHITAIVCVALCVTLSAGSAHAAIGPWTYVGDIQNVRSAHASVVADNGQVYTLGGHSTTDTGYTYITNEIDLSPGPQVGVLPAYAALFGANMYHSATVYKGWLYVVGGFSYPQEVFRIRPSDIGTNGDGCCIGPWYREEALGEPHDDGTTVAAQDRLYVIGGSTDAVSIGVLGSGGSIAYWTTGPSLPSHVTGARAAIVDGRIFVIGGNSTGRVYSSQIQSDGSLTPWSSALTLPEPIDDFGLATVGSDLYVIGGGNTTTGFSDRIYVGHVTNGTITSWDLQAAHLPEPRIEVTAVALGTTIRAIAGRNATGELRSVIDAETTSTLSDAELLNLYRPELRYDAQDTFRAIHPKTLFDNYDAAATNRSQASNTLWSKTRVGATSSLPMPIPLSRRRTANLC
jgi:hypothetical protein